METPPFTENIDCESEASFEVTRTVEKVTVKRRQSSRQLSSAISAIYSKESTTYQTTTSTTTASESQQKEFNSRDDAKLDTDNIQEILDEIDGNLKDNDDVGSINKKRNDPDQGNKRRGSTTEDGLRSRTGSDASQVDSVLDEGRNRYALYWTLVLLCIH